MKFKQAIPAPAAAALLLFVAVYASNADVREALSGISSTVGQTDATGAAESTPADSSTDSVRVNNSMELLASLPVTSPSHEDSYDRDVFRHWSDPDGNGCDSRNDILARDLDAHQVVAADTCTVTSGVMSIEPYTGVPSRRFTKDANNLDLALDIDHVVALDDAWVSGAWAWDADKREQFANDPLNLLAVDAHANRAKGSQSADQWLPANEGFWCSYVGLQIEIKRDYDLTVTASEHDTMAHVLETKC